MSLNFILLTNGICFPLKLIFVALYPRRYHLKTIVTPQQIRHQLHPHTHSQKKDIKISPKSDDLFHAFINTIFLCRHLKPISMAIILLDVVNDLGIEYYVYVWV